MESKNSYNGHPKPILNYTSKPTMDRCHFSMSSIFETIEEYETSFLNGKVFCQEFREIKETLLMYLPLLLRGIPKDRIHVAFQYSLQITADKFGYNYVNNTFACQDDDILMTHETIIRICDNIHKIILARTDKKITKLVPELLYGPEGSVDACRIAFEFLGL